MMNGPVMKPVALAASTVLAVDGPSAPPSATVLNSVTLAREWTTLKREPSTASTGAWLDVWLQSMAALTVCSIMLRISRVEYLGLEIFYKTANLLPKRSKMP